MPAMREKLNDEKSFEPASGFANVLLMAAGTLLLLMQLHGSSHSNYAEEFPINRDDHVHSHEEQDAGPPAHSHNPDGSHPPGIPDQGSEPSDDKTNAPDGDSNVVVPDHI